MDAWLTPLLALVLKFAVGTNGELTLFFTPAKFPIEVVPVTAAAAAAALITASVFGFCGSTENVGCLACAASIKALLLVFEIVVGNCVKQAFEDINCCNVVGGNTGDD